MSDGPNPANVLIGIFLILTSVCILLVGGGCTFFLVYDMLSFRGDRGLWPFLLLSLSGLGLGILGIWGGIRLLKPRDDGWDR